MFQFDRRRAPGTASGAAVSSAGFGLASLPAAIWRRKWWPIALAVMFGGMAIGYSATLVNQYQSLAQVLVDPRDLKILANEVSPNNLNSDSITNYIESQARIITSSDMLRRIVDREGLTKDGEFSGGGGFLSRLLPRQPEGDLTLATAERLSRNLWVRRGERTFIIDIAVTSSSAEKSARLANAFAAAYLEDQANYRAELSRRTSTSLTSRLNELRERVRQSEDKVQTYKTQKNIVGANGKLVTEEQLAAANAALSVAQGRVGESKAKLDQIESVRGQAVERGALPEAVNSNTLGLLRQQLGEAQRRATTLSTSLGPLHPEYLSAQSTLRDAQRAVADEIGRIRAAARIEYQRALNNERTTATQLESLKKETLVENRDTVQLRELERELEANRAIYQSFLQRARETGEQENVDSTNARIITTAVPAIEKSGPPKRLYVIGASLGGFLLGLVLAALAEFMAFYREGRGNSGVESENAETSGQADGGPLRPAPLASDRRGGASETAENGNRPSSTEDLMRLLKTLGQLEKAIDRYGMPR